MKDGQHKAEPWVVAVGRMVNGDMQPLAERRTFSDNAMEWLRISLEMQRELDIADDATVELAVMRGRICFRVMFATRENNP